MMQLLISKSFMKVFSWMLCMQISMCVHWDVKMLCLINDTVIYCMIKYKIKYLYCVMSTSIHLGFVIKMQLSGNSSVLVRDNLIRFDIRILFSIILAASFGHWFSLSLSLSHSVPVSFSICWNACNCHDIYIPYTDTFTCRHACVLKTVNENQRWTPKCKLING